MYLQQGKPPTNDDEQEAFRCGSYLHAARAKWFALEQKTDKATITSAQQAAKEDCLQQGYTMGELTTLEYELMFLNYANYWAIRVLPKPYAVELFLEYDFGKYNTNSILQDTLFNRTTRLDDLSFYPDVGGYCIGEFKTTYDLGGALKFYNENNPQILLQQLIYEKQIWTKQGIGTLPPIKGTMVDIWDKARNKGTRQYLPLNTGILAKFEVFICHTLSRRKLLVEGNTTPQRNYFVCNTFNDAYKSQCKLKERCASDTA